MRKIEVEEATARALERRAAEVGMSIAAVVSELELLDEPPHVSVEELAELDRFWTNVRAGEATVPHREVAKWLESWSDSDGKPWPEKCGNEA
jgi:hypothetical protein